LHMRILYGPNEHFYRTSSMSSFNSTLQFGLEGTVTVWAPPGLSLVYLYVSIFDFIYYLFYLIITPPPFQWVSHFSGGHCLHLCMHKLWCWGW
jgi:hypothetical protein